MKFTDLVKSRRSVRVYDKRNIKREDLELCIEAARHAPSACNSQPWKFIIIDDIAKKELIAASVLSGLYSMNTFAHKADVFIAIVSEKIKFLSWLGAKLRKTDYRHIDIGIACCQLLLQAQELGIGTCILGWFDERRLKKILSVPPVKKIELVIALGYPKNAKPADKYLKDKSEIISFNKY